MSTTSLGTIILIAVITFFLARSIKIVSENERFVIFKLGRYAGLKGPGLLLKFSGAEVQWIRLAIGTRGELVAPGIGHFNKAQVPIEIDTAATLGSVIRVTGFNADSVAAMIDPDQRKTVVCEKCGNEISI